MKRNQLNAVVAAAAWLLAGGPVLANETDSTWRPLSASAGAAEGEWSEHDITDYYVATTTIKSTTISLGRVPTPKLVIHADLPTMDGAGCTAMYVKDADYDAEFVSPALLKEIEERRQVMDRVHLAKAAGLPARLVISAAPEDRFVENGGDGPRTWCRIMRVSVR